MQISLASESLLLFPLSCSCRLNFLLRLRNRLGFLKLKALVEDETGDSLPGIVFLRGQSVAMLVIVYPSDDPSANNAADYDDGT